MHEVLSSLPLNYRFVEISSPSKFRILRQLSYVSSYLRIFLSLGNTDRGQILWLSEFKFSLPHVICAKLIAKLKGMILVGGPHTLRADAIWLTNPSFQREHLSQLQQMRIKLANLYDKWVMRLLDVVQSYSPMYAARAIAVCGDKSKPTIIFPIGQNVDKSVPVWEAKENSPRSITLVFWGIANTLHGLDILPPAAEMLRKRGISASIFIYSPANHYVAALLRDAEGRGVADLFHHDAHTVIRQDYSKVLFADLAISHLVSKSLHAEARSLMNAAGTPNKLYEILALGLPMIAARSDSILEAAGQNSCILIEPGDPISLANMIEAICAGKIDASEIARKGRHVALTMYSIPAITRFVANQLDAI